MENIDKLFIVMPAYNEEDNLRNIVEEWYPVVVSIGSTSRLVIIDDGSKDNTFQLLKELSADRPQLIPLTKPNSGHGPTILYGYHYAIENGADYIFQTDSDDQTLVEEFPPFWQQRKNHDMVCGYRPVREDGFFRLVITRTLRFLLKIIFGVWVKDANMAYRLMKTSSLNKIINKVPHDFFLSNVLVSVLFIKNGMAVKYIPVTVRPRQAGVNSINGMKIVKIGFKAIGDFVKIRSQIK